MDIKRETSPFYLWQVCIWDGRRGRLSSLLLLKAEEQIDLQQFSDSLQLASLYFRELLLDGKCVGINLKNRKMGLENCTTYFHPSLALNSFFSIFLGKENPNLGQLNSLTWEAAIQTAIRVIVLSRQCQEMITPSIFMHSASHHPRANSFQNVNSIGSTWKGFANWIIWLLAKYTESFKSQLWIYDARDAGLSLFICQPGKGSIMYPNEMRGEQKNPHVNEILNNRYQHRRHCSLKAGFLDYIRRNRFYL